MLHADFHHMLPLTGDADVEAHVTGSSVKPNPKTTATSTEEEERLGSHLMSMLQDPSNCPDNKLFCPAAAGGMQPAPCFLLTRCTARQPDSWLLGYILLQTRTSITLEDSCSNSAYIDPLKDHLTALRPISLSTVPPLLAN
jgi:hypothetical protein